MLHFVKHAKQEDWISRME